MRRKAGPRDVEIGECITRLRTARGLTMSDLAAAVARIDGLPPLSFQQMQKYESGDSRISVSFLEKIARVLNVSIEVFLEEKRPDVLANLPSFDLQAMKLLHMINALPRRKVAVVRNLVDALLEDS